MIYYVLKENGDKINRFVVYIKSQYLNVVHGANQEQEQTKKLSSILNRPSLLLAIAGNLELNVFGRYCFEEDPSNYRSLLQPENNHRRQMSKLYFFHDVDFSEKFLYIITY